MLTISRRCGRGARRGGSGGGGRRRRRQRAGPILQEAAGGGGEKQRKDARKTNCAGRRRASRCFTTSSSTSSPRSGGALRGRPGERDPAAARRHSRHQPILRDQTELGLPGRGADRLPDGAGVQMASWLRRRARLAPAVRLVQAFERLESAGLGAEALVESRVARLSSGAAQFTAADVRSDDVWLRTRLGGGATARLLSARRSTTCSRASARQCGRRRQVGVVRHLLVLVVEAACCLVDDLHHIHTEGVGGALAPRAAPPLALDRLLHRRGGARRHGVARDPRRAHHAASTSDFVRARKKMEFERTQREKERLKELRARPLSSTTSASRGGQPHPRGARRRRARRGAAATGGRRDPQRAALRRRDAPSVPPSGAGAAAATKPPATKGFFSLV